MIELEIERIIWRGRGLARTSSGKRAIVLPPVLPGEIILGEVIREKKDYVEVRSKKIIKPSIKRIPHPCPLSKSCGGCSFGILRYKDEIYLKKQIFEREFIRVFRQLKEINLKEIIVFPSPKKWGYRWRGQVFVENGTPHFKELNTNKLVALNKCLLFSPPINENLLTLVKDIRSQKIVVCASPYDNRTFTDLDAGPLILPFYVYDLFLKIKPGIFFQANWDLNQALIDFVVGNTASFEKIADLYAGCGNFSIPLASMKKQVIAIENDPYAIDNLKQFCKKTSLNIMVKRIDLFKKSPSSLLGRSGVECLIVDPPRMGGGKFISHLRDLKCIKRIIWVSCDIVNTARDIMPLLKAGWKITNIALFDMFPKTFHMEVVFVLDKGLTQKG